MSSVNVYGEHSEEAKSEFRAEKDKLIQQIEISYKRLQREIYDTESKLKIQ
jgi:hypothetical protein